MLDQSVLPAAVVGDSIDTRNRPLGALSEFVVSNFRPFLRRGREDGDFEPLLAAVNHLVRGEALSDAVQNLIVSSDADAVRLGALDCEMLITALTHHKLPIPPELSNAEATLCGHLGIPRCLSYELIVRANPEIETRTFFDGVAGSAERLFYLDHEAVEKALVEGVKCAEAGVNLLAAYMEGSRQGIDPARIERLFAQAGRSHALAVGRMIRFYGGEEIRPEDFVQFRVYLEGQNGKPGPSGLYSPGEHSLRMLVFGQALPDRVRLVEQHLAYFPSDDQADLTRIRRGVMRGDSARDLVMRGGAPTGVAREVEKLMGQIVVDMESHLQFVARFLGLDPNLTGTAGRGVAFLRSGIDRARGALAAVEALGQAGGEVI